MKISPFALCWVVVGPVWTVTGPFGHEDAKMKRDNYNRKLPAATIEHGGMAVVRLADGREVMDNGEIFDAN